MIWAAMLLSVSGYSWFLVVAYNISAVHPAYWTGLAGLFVVSIVPTILGFTFNRRLLGSGPTILKIITVNSLQYIFYAGITALCMGISKGYLFWITPGTLQTAHLLPFIWQLLAWLVGMYFAVKSDVIKSIDRPANVKAVEISLALIVPAIFLLTSTNFPAFTLIMIISCWFITLALTLAVGGTGFTDTSIIRYDIILFHALVPPLAGIILFIAAFYGEVRLLLQAAQKAFFTFLGFLFYLLDLLMAKPPKSDLPPPEISALPMAAATVEKVRELPSWFHLLFIALGLLLLIPILRGIIKLLKTRLSPVSPFPKRSYSLRGALLQMWRWVVILVCSWLKLCSVFFVLANSMIGKLRQKFKNMLRSLLPARTPEHKIFRAYEGFLRLGRKSGCPRKASETPLEYAGRLQISTGNQSFPNAEVKQLTWLFLEARYGYKPVSPQQAEQSDMLLKTITFKLKSYSKTQGMV